MRIAVIDVAAEYGGALSVLQDFVKYIDGDDDFCKNNTWVLYTSIPLNLKNEKASNRVISNVKKSWLNRLLWEQFEIKAEIEKERIDLVISLQNTALKKGDYKQIVFFHNVLLLEPRNKYSLLRKLERKYAIYTRLISPYTLHGLRKADYILCQTETVKMGLKKKVPEVSIWVAQPNIDIEQKYKDTATPPIKGLIYPTSATPFKRVEEVIECVKLHKEWFVESDFKILLTLSGEENAYSNELYKRSIEVQDVIKFIGIQSRPKLLDLYRQYGLIICSELESFSLPFVEAGYIGTPIVAADYPYAAERVEKLNNAFLYPPGDYEKMFDSIVRAREVLIASHNPINKVDNTWKIIQKLAKKLF